MTKKEDRIVDFVARKMRFNVEHQDGLVHRMWGFTTTSAVWTFFCGESFTGNAHEEGPSEASITCMACMASSYNIAANTLEMPP